jgi:hypothetical protein
VLLVLVVLVVLVVPCPPPPAGADSTWLPHAADATTAKESARIPVRKEVMRAG